MNSVVITYSESVISFGLYHRSDGSVAAEGDIYNGQTDASSVLAQAHLYYRLWLYPYDVLNIEKQTGLNVDMSVH